MRGAPSKDTIFKILMKVFPSSFMAGKELRIPAKENGEVVEIKVTLTAAKDVLGGENVQPAIIEGNQCLEMTEEEKEIVAKLLEELGFEVKR